MAVIKLDVVVPKNRDAYFQPVKGTLRGEIRLSEVRGVKNIPAQLSDIGGVIPGHRIEIDTTKRTARIVDRMHLPENADVDKKIREVIRNEELRERGGQTEFGIYSKEPERVFDLSNEPPHNMATWFYWLRRMFDDGKLRLESGTMPEMDKIRQMGKVWLGPDHGIKPLEGQGPINYLPELAAV